MIKTYICASFTRKMEAQILDLHLSPMLNIVSTWYKEDTISVARDGEKCKQRAMRDFQQLMSSELIIILIGDNQSGGGRHTELGLALGMKKSIILVGKYDSNPFEQIGCSRIFDTTEDLVEEFEYLRDILEVEVKWCKDTAKRNVLSVDEELHG